MTPPLCECCGREVGHGPRCQDCARDRPGIHGIRAAARYDGAVRLAIHRLKYNGHRAMAQPLAGFLEPVVGQLPPATVLAPLPLHPKRERQRGYNQARLLADHLGRRLGLPVVDAAARVRETGEQVGRSRAERQTNVKGAFVCADPGLVAGQTVLLIDDVCTTGSTLFACATPLLRAGAAQVWGLVVARQDQGRT